MFGDEIAIRAADARPRRRESRRGDARRHGLRDGRPQRRRSSDADRPADPGDGPRVGGLQLHVRVRSGRHARRSGSTSAPACARRCASRSSAGTATAIPTMRRARRSRSPMRVVHLSHDMEAIGRLFSPDRALEAARDRRDRTYDPALADLFVAHGQRLVRAARARSSRGTPCSPSSPSRTACSTATQLDDALTVAADFIDLKSPYMGGHSRRCAELAADAARVLGLAEEAVTHAPPRGARARLRHHGVPNSIWDKPGPLTRTEFDRVELHPMLTEQMLRRSPALAALNPVACRAPREVRRVRLPQARAAPTPAISARACWRRRRSTWG